LPALSVAAVIFVLSGIPHLHATEGALDIVLRKLAHVSLYALLASGCLRGVAAHGLRGGPASAAAFALAVAYAVADELHQTLVPGRQGAPLDVAIDAAGAALAVLVLDRLPRVRAALVTRFA
jgi:VanZ family protein